MPRKQSKKRGLIKNKKNRKSKTSFGRNSTRVNRKHTLIYNEFIDYLKNKKDYYKSSKDVYDCVTNPANNHYTEVKNAIIKFIVKHKLDQKPDDFNKSNIIEESLLDLIPLKCDNESS